MTATTRMLARALAVAAIGAASQAGAATAGQAPDWAPYFRAVAAPDAAPDSDGFLHRWLILDPIARPIRSNQNFTSTFVRETVAGAAVPVAAMPADGATVTLAGTPLRWHALDAVPFDVKLFNVAQSLHQPTYGVVFWVTTVVVADRDIPDAHLAVGSNSASMWWLNGAPVANLFGDRRMVEDDIVSPGVALHKGRNVLRGAVINGPGLSDFCARFIDDAGRPITDLRIALR